MILFLVGVLEMVIVTAWTKTVSDTKVFSSGVITFVNILIWYYVLETIVNDIGNWQLVVLYAFGCAVGTVLCMYYFRYKEARAQFTTQEEAIVS